MGASFRPSRLTRTGPGTSSPSPRGGAHGAGAHRLPAGRRGVASHGRAPRARAWASPRGRASSCADDWLPGVGPQGTSAAQVSLVFRRRALHPTPSLAREVSALFPECDRLARRTLLSLDPRARCRRRVAISRVRNPSVLEDPDMSTRTFALFVLTASLAVAAPALATTEEDVNAFEGFDAAEPACATSHSARPRPGRRHGARGHQRHQQRELRS